MKFSVIIPAYNASKTIDATIDSVLGQTRPAEEILVMDDGSTDDTFARLQAYGSKIKLFRHPNQGAAVSRNCLCRKAMGDVAAFLDADDVWHEDYLKAQHDALSKHSNSIASFTGFVDSNQFSQNSWNSLRPDSSVTIEPMDSIQFFNRYNYLPLQFPPSACCIVRDVLDQMGPTPFPLNFDSVEDYGFMNTLPLFSKPIIRNPLPLVMYRLGPASLSSNRVKVMDLTIRLAELLLRRYEEEAAPGLLQSFREMFPAKRRNYSKYLMGAGRVSDARHQIWISIRENRNLKSMLKSAGLLACSYFPSALQPKWPRQFRHENYQ